MGFILEIMKKRKSGDESKIKQEIREMYKPEIEKMFNEQITGKIIKNHFVFVNEDFYKKQSETTFQFFLNLLV